MTGLWRRVARWWSGSRAEPPEPPTNARRVLVAVDALQPAASPGAVADVLAENGDRLALPAVYLALDQLVADGLIASWAVAATPECTGRERMRYWLTDAGVAARRNKP